MIVVHFDDVRKEYGDTTALDGVSLRIRPGAAVAVMGPSGCGKSTLLNVVAGLAADFNALIGSLLNNEPGNGRTARLLATVVLPVGQPETAGTTQETPESVEGSDAIKAASSPGRARNCATRAGRSRRQMVRLCRDAVVPA